MWGLCGNTAIKVEGVFQHSMILGLVIVREG